MKIDHRKHQARRIVQALMSTRMTKARIVQRAVLVNPRVVYNDEPPSISDLRRLQTLAVIRDAEVGGKW